MNYYRQDFHNNVMTTTTNAGKTVLAFVQALNDEDFDKARTLITDDVSFVGVLGQRDGGDAYIDDMKKMRFKYRVDKVFEDGNDVCLWYEIDMSGPKVPSCGWYQVEGDKVKSFKVLFDPRPVLEASK